MAITYTTFIFDTAKELVEFLLLCKANPAVSQLEIVQRFFSQQQNVEDQSGLEASVQDLLRNPNFKHLYDQGGLKEAGQAQRSAGASGGVPAVKKRRTRADGPPLTEQIKQHVEQLLNKKQEFSAMDIYNRIVETEGDENINKQSVISSVQKLMEGPYSHVSREFRQGKGPRPKKIYTPA